MTYHVLDVCRYVINYSNQKGYGISNLKLQKILYFIQAYFLCSSYGDSPSPCFYESIEAWDFGPVVPEAYHEYKQYRSSSIPTVTSYMSFDEEDMWNISMVPYDDNIIQSEDKEKINAVVDMFAKYSATDLVTLTHNQAPWRDAYVSRSNREITIESIRRYFNDEE